MHPAIDRTLPGRPATRNPDPGALVRELLRPEAYPGPRPTGVEVRHSHGSWVFLTDGEAWKVRRPIDDELLDQGDADRRRRCAEEEVRRGRRLAPAIYQGVVPLHRGAAGTPSRAAGRWSTSRSGCAGCPRRTRPPSWPRRGA
jgi:hypothetical protein